MKVLITGASGLLGGHLLQTLQQRGEQIRALILPVENADKLIAQGVEVARGDVTDANTLAPAVKDVALVTRTRPLVPRLGTMMFGTDNRHSVEKARSELGYEPKVDIREGIRRAAAWFNAGGMEQQVVTQASRYATLGGTQKS